MKDLIGKLVSEEEVATDLGFKDVHEFRRWQTEQGKRVAELEYALKQAKNEAERFRWHLMRSLVVIDKAEEFLTELKQLADQHKLINGGTARVLREAVIGPKIDKLLLAFGVMHGNRGKVDWDHILDDWLKPLNHLHIKIEGEWATLVGILDGNDHALKECQKIADFTGPLLKVNTSMVSLQFRGVDTWIRAKPKKCLVHYEQPDFAKAVFDREETLREEALQSQQEDFD